MKKGFTFNAKQLLIAGLSLLSLSANAQFKVDITRYANTDYSPKYAEFKLSEVAKQVGTDAATLAGALDTWYAKDGDSYTNEDTKLFGIDDGTGAVNTGYNADGRGSYWLNPDGTLGAWGAGAVYNSVLDYNATDDYIKIPVGNHPETGDAETVSATLKFIMNYNSKQATFTVNYTVNPLPEVPAAPQFYTGLSIVGKTTASSEQTPNSSYATKPVSVTISDLASKLGADEAIVAASISKMVNMRQYDTEYGLNSDTLQILSSYSDGWVGKSLSAEGDTTNICAAHVYGSGCTMFMQGWAYDATTKELTFNVGQYPSALVAGNSAVATLYICYGSKAYQVDYTLNVIAPAYKGLPDMTCKGTTDFPVEQVVKTDYSTDQLTVDTEAIAAELGCTTGGLSLYALADADQLTDESSANNGGYWLSEEGYRHAYSGASFFIEPATSGDYSKLNIGQMPNTLTAGSTYNATLYLVNGENGTYWTLNITLKVSEKADDGQSEFKVVAKKPGTIQQVIDTEGYTWSDQKFTIPNTELEKLLGTTDVTLYAENLDSIAQATGEAYTSTYSMDPAPGFWMSADGKKTTWGASSPWGMTIGQTTDLDGVTFECMQFPGETNIGDNFVSKFYLVNMETKEMLEVDLTFQVVETLTPLDEVGNVNITVPVSSSDSEIDFDTNDIATKLGVTDLFDGYYLRGAMADGQYSTGVAAKDGVTVTTQGYVEDMQTTGIYFSDGKICTYSNEELADDWQANATLRFEYDGKSYVVNVRLMSKALYDQTGIENVAANSAKAGKIYTIGGVQVKNAVKGVYIQNGKKFVK